MLDEGGRVFHGSIDVLISFSLFVFGIFSYEFCQRLFVSLFIFMSASWYVILFINTELDDVIASLAALSAQLVRCHLCQCERGPIEIRFFFLSLTTFLGCIELFHFWGRDF